MAEILTIGDRDIFLVVDLQNDFCPGGNLAVPRGNEVVPLINRLATKFQHVVLTQDWHPRGHQSFASSHGKQHFQTIDVSYGTQILWPDHCVQHTAGAAFHDELHIPHAELVLRKGYHREIDSYSAFYENDRKTATGLSGYLRERGFIRVLTHRQWSRGVASTLRTRRAAHPCLLGPQPLTAEWNVPAAGWSAALRGCGQEG